MIKDLIAWAYIITFSVLIAINLVPHKENQRKSSSTLNNKNQSETKSLKENRTEKAIKSGKLSNKKALFYREAK